MKILLVLFFVQVVNSKLLQSFRGDEVTKNIQKHGYGWEVHEIVTSDGYILRLHRLLASDSSNNVISQKPAVFMLHGLFSTSGQFVQLGPQKSLGFYLADNGYDVWLGGMRGGRYGMKHKYLSSNSKKFWNFSLTEIALFDVAEQIDYILSETEFDKLFVTGVAVTTIPLTILLTEKPEYNDKIIQASYLSAVIWAGGRPDTKIDTIAYGTFYAILGFIPFFPFKAFESLMVFFRDNVCLKRPPSKDFCNELYFIQSLMYGDTGGEALFDTVRRLS